MLTLFRWLLRLTVGLIVVLVAAVALSWYFAIRSLPDYTADFSVEGVAAPVEIVRTTEGVPHIFGTTDRDVYFALGFAHAQDRLFQMTVLRRAAQGRLSEIYGAGAFASDDLARRLGLYRNAGASLAAQSPATRAALDAYASGVNAWIAQVNLGARGRGAPEFFLYPDDISYWEPADSLAILKLLAATTTTQMPREILRARLSLTDPARGGEILASPGEPLLEPYRDQFPGTKLARPDHPLRPYDWVRGLAGFMAPGIGASANGFAATGARTAANGALLANDPQFALTAPGLWYLARLELNSGGVIGGTIPGIPAVLSGRNSRLAWGMTPAQIDDQDIFIEEVQPGEPNRYRSTSGWTDFVTRREIIRVKDMPDQTITLRLTENGPVIPEGHMGLASITPQGHVPALSWTGSSAEDRTMSALVALMSQHDRTGAVRVLRDVTAPAMTYTLADQSGIAQTLAGAVPNRPATHQTAGRMPTPGWLAQNRWQGSSPAPAALTTLSPDAEVLAATGSLTRNLSGSLTGSLTGAGPISADGRVLGYDGADDRRIERLGVLIDEREVHSRDSFIAAQNDIVSPVARDLLPLVAADLWFTGEPAAKGTPERQRQDALGLLANWDGAMNEHLPEPLIYSAWMRELQDRILRDELGPIADDLTRLYPDFIERVFRDTNGASIWCDIRQSAPVETCLSIAERALDQAILDLSARFGPDVTSWRWGDVHLARQAHPALGDIRGLSYVVNLVQPTSGDGSTVARAGLRGTGGNPWLNMMGASYRGVYDLADPDSSVFVISTGQSGHPLSLHYDDLAGLWRRGEYVAMSLDPDLARAGASGVTRLLPAPR